MADTDTIAAIATPPGRGGVSIVRISGPKAKLIAQSILGDCPKPRYASFAQFKNLDDELIDEGLAIYFPAPHSYTGEEILELHGHGGAVVSDMILQAVLAAGARMARAGEFSERAFLNDKLDLAQAEAVADLIDAGSQRAAKAALRTLEGEFSTRVSSMVEELIALRVYIESSLDFADEEIELLNEGDIETRLNVLRHKLTETLQAASLGTVLGQGLHVVIAGLPNAGKSSLMNALTGRESAIVTDMPGTTRDIIREQLTIEGIPIYLHDTAGLRDDAERIEQEGIRRARGSLANADLVLWVHDDTAAINRDLYQEYLNNRLILVLNKIDLSGRAAGPCKEEERAVAISTLNGEGLEMLKQQIAQISDVTQASENDFSARRRHILALQQAETRLIQAQTLLTQQLGEGGSGELLAEELRQAQDYLNEITGQFNADDLLGKIFTEFCIGK